MRILRRKFLKIVGAAATACSELRRCCASKAQLQPNERSFLWKSNEVVHSHQRKVRQIGSPAQCESIHYSRPTHRHALLAPASHLNPAHALRGTRIRSDKRSSSQADAVGRNGRAVRLKRLATSNTAADRNPLTNGNKFCACNHHVSSRRRAG